MKDYVKRMCEEIHQLDEKLEKLSNFLKKKPEITKEEDILLYTQRDVMDAYLRILTHRLAIEMAKENITEEEFNSLIKTFSKEEAK